MSTKALLKATQDEQIAAWAAERARLGGSTERTAIAEAAERSASMTTFIERCREAGVTTREEAARVLGFTVDRPESFGMATYTRMHGQWAAVLDAVMAALAHDEAATVLSLGTTRHGEWHHASCWSAPFQPCPPECRDAQDRLAALGRLPSGNIAGAGENPKAYGMPAPVEAP